MAPTTTSTKGQHQQVNLNKHIKWLDPKQPHLGDQPDHAARHQQRSGHDLGHLVAALGTAGFCGADALLNLRRYFPGEQLVNGDVQGSGQSRQQRNIRKTVAVLPLGDGAVANLQLGRQLHLGQPQRLAVGADGAPNLFCVHICGAGTVVPALLSLVYDFIVAERENLCNRRTVEVVHAPWNCNFFWLYTAVFLYIVPGAGYTGNRKTVVANGTALLR